MGYLNKKINNIHVQMWAGLDIIARNHVNFLKIWIFMMIIWRSPHRHMHLLIYFSCFYYTLMIKDKKMVCLWWRGWEFTRKDWKKWKVYQLPGGFMRPAPIGPEFFFFEFIPKASNIIKQEENPCASVWIFKKDAIKFVKILENPFSTMYK